MPQVKLAKLDAYNEAMRLVAQKKGKSALIDLDR
jgi:hypothetical protein